jgi:hypothetical protein
MSVLCCGLQEPAAGAEGTCRPQSPSMHKLSAGILRMHEAQFKLVVPGDIQAKHVLDLCLLCCAGIPARLTAGQTCGIPADTSKS